MSAPYDSDIIAWLRVNEDGSVDDFTEVDFLPDGFVQLWEARAFRQSPDVLLCVIDVNFAYQIHEAAYRFGGGTPEDVSATVLPGRGIALEPTDEWGPAPYKQLTWQTKRGD